MLKRSLWQPGELNWWIGTVFACGASLFLLGALLCLQPQLASAWSLDAYAINAVFFAGSIPFTTAAYLQLYQAANAPALQLESSTGSAQKVAWIGWQPGNIGWLSCVLQFAGTVLFNINTFDAMQPDLDWLQQDIEIWAPNMAGSILFLASGHLAFMECCHGRRKWLPGDLSWCITVINLLGCIAFMASAALAFVTPSGAAPAVVELSIGFTALGALAFLIGALLLWPETVPGQGE